MLLTCFVAFLILVLLRRPEEHEVEVYETGLDDQCRKPVSNDEKIAEIQAKKRLLQEQYQGRRELVKQTCKLALNDTKVRH